MASNPVKSTCAKCGDDLQLAGMPVLCRCEPWLPSAAMFHYEPDRFPEVVHPLEYWRRHDRAVFGRPWPFTYLMRFAWHRQTPIHAAWPADWIPLNKEQDGK